MFESKVRWLLLLSLFVTLVSAANQTVSEMESEIGAGLCTFKTLVTDILPTLAIVMFVLAGLTAALAFIILRAWVSQYNKRNPEAKLRLREFRRLRVTMKIAVVLFALPVISLITGGIIAIILAVLAPSLLKTFIEMSTGTSLPANC